MQGLGGRVKKGEWRTKATTVGPGIILLGKTMRNAAAASAASVPALALFQRHGGRKMAKGGKGKMKRAVLLPKQQKQTKRPPGRKRRSCLW